MPILRKGTPYGMGQVVNPLSSSNPFFANCAWWDVACWTGLDSLLSSGALPQAPAGSVPPPALSTPAAPQTFDEMMGTWTPEQSAAQTAINSQQDAQNFFNSLSTPGGSTPASAVPCDWTQAGILNLASWCPMNWLMAGGVALGLAYMLHKGIK
jgi:hypothetical protein